MAHDFYGDINVHGATVTGLATPSGATDAAPKSYVDGQIAGVRDPKDSVRLATAAALPAYTRSGNVLTADANGALTVDGVAVAINERVLVKDGAAGADNGVFDVTATGSGGAPYVLTRSSDADTSAEVTSGLYVWVNEGTANADTGFLLITNDPITLNTTSLSFSQVSGLGQVTAGGGVGKSGNTLSVAAGTGIAEETDGVAIDKTLVPVYKTGLIGGAGPATSYTVTNPGFAVNARITVEILEESSGKRVFPEVSTEADGDIVVAFGSNSVAGTAFRYLAVGLAP